MRIVLLASGSGTLTQAVIDAFADADRGVEIVGVGSDSQTAGVIDRAKERSIPTFVVRPKDCPSREDWNMRLRDAVTALSPDWVISAGFMRILGPAFVSAFDDRIINTHPALLPAFPGAHGVRDALAHGVRVTGGTIHIVDAGVDTGPIIAQFAIPIGDEDTEDTVHERIKVQERIELVRLLDHLAHHDLVIDGRHVSGYATSAASS